MQSFKKQINNLLVFSALTMTYTAIDAAPSREQIEDSVNPKTLRCGLDSLYLATRFLTGESGPALYHKMGKVFPDAETKGMSLSEIKSYLEGQKFSCSYGEINAVDVKDLSKSSIVFLLKEDPKAPHILLLRRTNDDEFMLIDAASKNPQRKTAEEIRELKYLALFVDRSAGNLSFLGTPFSKHALPVSLFLGGVMTLFLAFRKKRLLKGANTMAKQLLSVLVLFFMGVHIANAQKTELVSPKNPPGLYCAVSSHDFGVVPIENEQGKAQHEFVIENTTDEDVLVKEVIVGCSCVKAAMKNPLIPKRSNGILRATISLRPDDFEGRTVPIGILPDSKTIEPIMLTVSAKAGFSAFSIPPQIDFSEVNANTEKDTIIECFRPMKTAEIVSVKNVKFDKPSNLSAEIIKTSNTKVKDEKIGEYYPNKTILSVVLKPGSKDVGRIQYAKMVVEMTNGESVTLPIAWRVNAKPIFYPHATQYILINLKPNETRFFRVIYNEDSGGKMKNLEASGVGLEIIERKHQGDAVFIKLRYTSKEKVVSQEVANLLLKTQDGKVHKLAILADAAE